MVSTIDMMKARENRAKIQQAMLEKYNLPIVYFSMNIPGPEKTNELFRYAFNQGKQLLLAQIEEEKINIVYQDTIYSETGDEFYMVCDSDKLTLKRIGVYVEEIKHIGRLFDVDIIDTDGLKVDRSDLKMVPRRCLICDNYAVICSRSRSHSVEEMIRNITKRINDYKKENFINETANKAVKALLYEVSITPKPGLVDRKDNGSHTDMNYYSFIDSAISLTEELKEFLELGLSAETVNEHIIWTLKGIGKKAEQSMKQATNNVNTHKGAIFSLGVFLFSIGYIYPENNIEKFRETLKQLAQYFNLSHQALQKELAEGYPTVFDLALPIYWQARKENLTIDEAGIKTLLYIMSQADDSNIIRRSNIEKAKEIKASIRQLLSVTNDYSNLASILNREFIDDNISAGGSADLLMLTIFSDSLFD